MKQWTSTLMIGTGIAIYVVLKSVSNITPHTNITVLDDMDLLRSAYVMSMESISVVSLSDFRLGDIVVIFSPSCEHCRNSISEWRRLIIQASSIGRKIYFVSSPAEDRLMEPFNVGLANNLYIDVNSILMNEYTQRGVPWWIVGNSEAKEWLIQQGQYLPISLIHN